MKVSEKTRKRVANRYNGKCAFCGCELGKGWHIWDIKPIVSAVGEDGCITKINTEEENLMAACKSCGSLRIRSTSHKMDIEEFRKEVLLSFEFLRTGGITATSYGRSIRFGLIVETQKPVVFYFETIETK